MRTHILYYINAFMCACVKKLTLPFVSNSLPEEKCAIMENKIKKHSQQQFLSTKILAYFKVQRSQRTSTRINKNINKTHSQSIERCNNNKNNDNVKFGKHGKLNKNNNNGYDNSNKSKCSYGGNERKFQKLTTN